MNILFQIVNLFVNNFYFYVYLKRFFFFLFLLLLYLLFYFQKHSYFGHIFLIRLVSFPLSSSLSERRTYHGKFRL